MSFGLVSCPGSKGYLSKQILEYIPQGVPVYSPFMGGGAVEYALARRGQRVFGFDVFQDMVNLHQQFIGNQEALIRELLSHLPVDTRGKWESLRDRYYRERNPFFRAVYFFLVWRSCRAPTPEHLHWGNRESKKHRRAAGPTPKGVTNLRAHRVENMSVRLQSYQKTLDSLPAAAVVYLDPPYPQVSGIYYKGHKEFDHLKFSRRLDRLENPWILSYPHIPDLIEEFYPGRRVIPLKRINGSVGNPYDRPGGWGEVLILGNMEVDG